MKKEELFEAIGDINEEYVEEAHKASPKKVRSIWMKVGAMVACLCLVVGLAAIFPWDGNGEPHGPHEPEIVPPDNDMQEEVPGYSIQGVSIEFYDCYIGEQSDVLVLYFPDITLKEIYIKEVDIDNKIIDVKVRNDTKEVTFENGVYAVDVDGLEAAYVEIHFAPGTLEGNKIIQDNPVDDEPNVDLDPLPENDAEHRVDTDEYHESQTTNITTLTFLCSITMPDGGYEQITYVKNFDYINDEPLINLVGRTDTIEEAMEIVDIEQVLVLDMEGHEIDSIVYDKNNTSTCVTVDYDLNSFVTIRTIAQNGASRDEIVERYVDTELYLLDENYVDITFDSGCTGNLYVCYKSDTEWQGAFAVLEYHENFQDYFLVIEIDLYGEDLKYSFKEILNQMHFEKR